MNLIEKMCFIQQVLKYHGMRVFYDNGTRFAGMAQVYNNKIATTLKVSAIEAYPVHFVLLIFLRRFCSFLINCGHTLATLLPVLTFEKFNGEENEKQKRAIGTVIFDT